MCCNASCGHVGVAIHKKFLPLVDCCSGEVILHCYIRCCSNMQAGSLYGADVMLAIRCNVEVCFMQLAACCSLGKLQRSCFHRAIHPRAIAVTGCW